MNRRSFLSTAAAAPLVAATGWVDLFDGKSLRGWKPSGNATSWKVDNGQLVGDGPVSHLFYTGNVEGAMFRNFELEAEVWTAPACNSGVYFHTAFQQEGFPKKGFEVQVNNTALGEGTYRERKRTGSLYSIRNVHQQLVRDEEWFRLLITVRGKNVQVRVNGALVVDYLEPTPPVRPPSQETDRYLDQGTFALQCHDPGSKVRYRTIRVRPLPAWDNANESPFTPDDTFRQIISLGAKNYPLVDWHVHLHPTLDLKEALERSRRSGINAGIACNAGRKSSYNTAESVDGFWRLIRNQGAFVGFQAEGDDWQQVFPKSVWGKFDYVFNDGLIWTDNGGWRRIFRKEEAGDLGNGEKFIDEFVDRTVNMILTQPIDFYGTPTFLPAELTDARERLWTERRMTKVIDALVKAKVALEINDRYKIPTEKFLKLAKAAGCRFSLGSGNSGPQDLRRCEYGLEMIAKVGIQWSDLFMAKDRPGLV